MKQHVTTHELPCPSPRGVTLHGDRLGIIVGGDDHDAVVRNALGRFKVRTVYPQPADSVGGPYWALGRIDFISEQVLRDFAHGILRTIGDES